LLADILTDFSFIGFIDYDRYIIINIFPVCLFDGFAYFFPQLIDVNFIVISCHH